MLKGIIFYTIISTIAYVIAVIAGADMAWAMLISLLAPPVLLLIYGILYYTGRLS